MQAMNYSVTNGSIEEAKIQQLLDVLHYDPTKVDNPLHQLLADASIEFALSDDVAINNPNTGKQDFNNPDQKIVDMMYLFTKIRKADGGHDDVTRDLVQTLGATINTKGMQDKFSRDYLGESIHTNHEYASDSGDYHKDNYRVETRQAWERGYDNGEMPSP